MIATYRIPRQKWAVWIVWAVLLTVWFAGAQPTMSATGKEHLDELVKKANEEGQLIATMQSSWARTLAPKLTSAFKNRFGLNIDMSVTPVRPAKHFAVAIAETQAGAPATYDVIQADDSENMALIGAGGTQKIDNWEALLAEINPVVGSGKVQASQISRGPFTGTAFQFMRNIKVIIYNTRLISEKDLPKMHADLTDRKYKEKWHFTQPPWTAHWEIAPAVFDNLDKAEWLDVVRQAGKNTDAVMSSSTGSQRVALGEFAFGLGHDTYVQRILSKDPKAPIAAAFFADYNESNATYYIVRKGARHPAAATLFALWMTTPEAEAIWQPSARQAQPWGDSKRDKEQAQLVREADANIVGFLDNERTIELLEWYSTDEGRKYLGAMSRAIRGE